MGKDLVGRTFGRLTVKCLSEYVVTTTGKRMSVWECVCICGATKKVKRTNLISGDTQSCGCIQKEILVKRNKTHGETATLTYRRWQGMHKRVRNAGGPKNKCYIGVTIHEEWDSYDNFKRDMGKCPVGYSLDRIDNSKGYTPANCRWIPLAKQAANTTRNVFVEVKGVVATISDHAKANGIKPDVAFDRINKLRWSVEDAVFIPTMGVGKKRTKNSNG